MEISFKIVYLFPLEKQLERSVKIQFLFAFNLATWGQKTFPKFLSYVPFFSSPLSEALSYIRNIVEFICHNLHYAWVLLNILVNFYKFSHGEVHSCVVQFYGVWQIHKVIYPSPKHHKEQFQYPKILLYGSFLVNTLPLNNHWSLFHPYSFAISRMP